MKKIEMVENAIRKSKKFIITAHINPEGDSLGSQLAMAGLLSSLDKDFVIFNSDRAPKHYKFLPGIGLIRNKIAKKNKDFDTAIVLDCPNLRRTGKAESVVKEAKSIINIDHHVSNENFGDINWVWKDASSAAEMVYRLYKQMHCKITKENALCLYIAILTDTGSFRYSNTSSLTHEIISELLEYGIEPYSVSRRVYENKTLGGMKLLGKVLSDIRLAMGGKVAYAVAKRSDFVATKTNALDCENFVNFIRSIEGVYVALFFREDDKKKHMFHVNLRSKKKVDVNKVASFFGGGGHKSAAGCILHGNLEQVKTRILEKIKNEF